MYLVIHTYIHIYINTYIYMYMYTYMNQCDDVRLHQCDDVRVAAHGGHQTQILGQYIYIYICIWTT